VTDTLRLGVPADVARCLHVRVLQLRTPQKERRR
jgi:hypothetical protein